MKKYFLNLVLLIVLAVSLTACSSQNTNTIAGHVNIDNPQIRAINNEPSTVNNEEPQVKKSTTGICHEKGTTYYGRTQHFQPFNSIEDCLNSGGRLPLK